MIAKMINPACSKGMMKMGSYNPRASFIRYNQTATKKTQANNVTYVQ